MSTFVNISERYGNSEPVTLADYQELNPDGVFELRPDGIFELRAATTERDEFGEFRPSSEWVRVAQLSWLTTAQVAERLGISQRRVQALIRSGRLPAERIGRDWLIREVYLAEVAERKPGRPVKRG